MYQIAQRLYFETLTEAKLELILRIAASSMPDEAKAAFIRAVQSSIEQHDNKATLLELIKAHTNPENEEMLETITGSIQRSPFCLPLERLNKHPTLRVVDSFLPIQLLLYPTDRMKEIRDRVSQVIVATLEKYLTSNLREGQLDRQQLFLRFVKEMIFEKEQEYPGNLTLAEINQGLDESEQIVLPLRALTLKQIHHILDLVITKLKAADTPNYQIIAIHFLFSQYLLKNVVLEPQTPFPEVFDNPVYERIIRAYNEKFHTNISLPEFLNTLRLPGRKGDEARSFISDSMMYESALFFLDDKEERSEPDFAVKTSTLGIMGNEEQTLKQLFELLEHPPWVDWSTCPIEPTSRIVQSMLENETPFVSSYSGISTLLCNLILSGNPVTLTELQSYLCSAVGYIVGVGCHSIHEVLAPPAYCLGAIPQDVYPVAIPTTPDFYYPPQYNGFYETVEKFDSQFVARHTRSWEQLNLWYRDIYKVHHRPPSLPQLIQYAIKKYIEARGHIDIQEYLNELGQQPLSEVEQIELSEFIQTVIDNPLLRGLIESLPEEHSLRKILSQNQAEQASRTGDLKARLNQLKSDGAAAQDPVYKSAAP